MNPNNKWNEHRNLRGVEEFLLRQREAGAAYCERQPALDLTAVVACRWARVVRRTGRDPLIPVIPDGCADIITCDEGAPVLVGPDRQARWPELAADTVITGLRLRPGALRAVLGGSAVELVDATARLDELSRAARPLHEELHSATNLELRWGLLEGWVRTQLRSGTHEAAVIQACRMLSANPSIDVAEVADELGWSVRKAHREFIAACGYGPKTMQRILRVQRVIRTVHRAPRPPRLVDVAAGSGFADQAHMTREFRALTGFTPTVYLARSNPELGRWLDQDWS